MASTLQIDAKTLAAIDDLSLLARYVVEGFLDGLHRSPFLGYSTEFASYRAYTQGDNLRHIDWKVWARSDEWYVKQFEDDTNLRCQIFLDASASMDFGAGSVNKFDYGRTLAAVLAELMVRQRDAPGLVLYSDRVNQFIPPRASRHHAEDIFQLLSHAQAGGGTGLDHSMSRMIESFSRRGMAVVISDFLTTNGMGIELLRQLQAQNQETLVFHLLAPEELELPYDGEFIFEDSETAEELTVHADDFRAAYKERLGTFCNELKAQCVQLEVQYDLIRTDAPLDGALVSYLESRGTI